MFHVFISYSRRDASWVTEVLERLETAGIEFWIDQRDIPATLPWREEIRDAIEDAALFVMCASAQWERSPACIREMSIALELRKPLQEAGVDQEPATAAGAIIRARASVPRRALHATELAARSREWDRAGRSRRLLVGLRQWGRLRRVAPPKDVDSLAARAFLRASLRRSLRRFAVVVTGVAAVLTGALFMEVLERADQQVRRSEADQVRAYRAAGADMASIRSDVFAGLRAAAGRGDAESAVNAEVIARALEDPTPDDGFDIPGDATELVVDAVADEVIVRDEDGALWSRSAQDPTAFPRPYRRRLPPQPAPPNLRAQTTRRSGIIRLLREGRLYRRVAASSPPAATSLSPDGRFTAAAVRDAVEIFDVDTGLLRLRLRGLPAPATDLAWNAGSSRLWAIAAGKVLSWQVVDGDVLVDKRWSWFQALLPTSRPDVAWLVERDGVFTMVALDTGRVLATRRVGEDVYIVAGDASGERAAIIAESGNRIVDLVGSEPSRRIDMPDCVAGRPAFTEDGSQVLVPCQGGDIAVISTETGTAVGSIEVPGPGASSVVVSGDTGAVFIGGEGGEIYRWGAAGPLRLLHTRKCRAAVIDIALAARDRYLLSVGEGSGRPGCGVVGHLSEDGWTWNSFIDALPDSMFSQTGTFIDGAAVFAVGYSDGTIVLRPTRNIAPDIRLKTIPGAIRHLHYVAESKTLYAVTRAGRVQRIEMEHASLTNRALARVAAARLARAVDLGLR